MTERSSDPVVYLDTNVFILLLEGTLSASKATQNLFDALRYRKAAAVTSELTLAELFVGPKVGPKLKRAYLDLIVWGKFIDLVPVSRGILIESARLRSMHRSAHGKKLELPDAIHLVTAIRKKCRYFMSADAGIYTPREVKKVAPNIEGVEQVLKALT